MRIGHGYDVHRLVPDRKLILGGVTIPYELGLLGHSDADVLLHAVSDALLGAAGLGDIGRHFPDTDPKYKNADSLKLLAAVGEKITAAGYVRLEHKTVLKAVPVFSFFVILAMILNEIAYQSGLLETEEFNMFFISRHCEPSLPVYSLVQGVLPFPWCLIVYVLGFSAAAFLVLLASMGIRKLYVKCAFHHAKKVKVIPA